MDIIGLERLRISYGEIASALKRLGRLSISTVALSQKLHLLSFLNKKMLYVAGEENSSEVADLLNRYGVKTEIFPAEADPIMYRSGVALAITSARVSALQKWIEGEISCLVVTPEVLAGYLPSKQLFMERCLTLQVGEEWDISALAISLAKNGYIREERAECKGTYSLSGDILEIFPINSDLPLRIMTDFDTIESIKYFQPETMTIVRRLEKVTIPPSSDVIIPREAMVGLLDKIRKNIGLQNAKAKTRTDEILSDLELQMGFGGASALNWLYPFVLPYLSTLFDYIDFDDLIVIDEDKAGMDKLNRFYEGIKAKVSRLIPEGEALRDHYNSVVPLSLVNEGFNLHKVLEFSNYRVGISAPEDGLFVRDSRGLPSYFANLGLLTKDVDEFLSRGYEVVMFGGSKENVASLHNFFGDKVFYREEKLTRGFIDRYAKVMVVGVADMNIKATAKAAEKTPRKTIAPRVGDYVVHEEYGIGQCLGVQHVKSYVGERDYLVLQYAGENKIFLPVHQMDMLSFYAGSDKTPKLSNPNKGEFAKEKEKARKSIKKLAIDLLELYAKREESRGYKYPKEPPLEREFESAFEYEETADQAQAILEIKRDMESGRVMDRLICGDVGFGKTEVAFRAVFKTVLENRQAAILAPTTILAEQHYMNAVNRFGPFGVRVACLTRFRTKEEVQSILAGVASGSIGLVIGTHRILSKDVNFYDLGLLVLDEEQRFGVEQKEKLKLLRTNVNVLSMSATPIPRTLDMALSGIRDISVLDTPPKGRQAVKTLVAEYSDSLLKEAVGKELARGGQTFILINNIEKLAPFASRVKEFFPEARIVMGHGRMPSDVLEKNIYKFYNKEADILVSTTIIENGIDIPDANTLVVIDSDRLGLSQMYQLKGRVGRSSTLASAYFTYPENKILDTVARKRLEALSDNSDLGAGYRLALMDLEIRGAGNVLGREQHGHVEKIGYDMYCKLLRETVSVLKGETVGEQTYTEVCIRTNAYIGEDYVKSERERLKLYKRIAEISSLEEREEILSDVKEMYGEVPKPVVNLVDVSLLRVLGSRVGVSKVVADNENCKVIWKNGDYANSTSAKTAEKAISKKAYVKHPDPFTYAFVGAVGGISGKIALLREFLANANGIII